jgi:hypothetical protein
MPNTLFTNYVTPLDQATMNSLLAGDGASNTGTALLGQAATDNVGLFTALFGTAAARVLALGGQATAPTTSPADVVQLWVADLGGVAGKAALHLREEGGIAHALGQYIVLGTAEPFTTTVLQMEKDGAGNGITQRTYGVSGNTNSFGLTGQTARNTKAAPQAVQTDDTLLFVGATAYDGSTFPGNKATLQFRASETWSGSAAGTHLRLELTPPGSTTRALKLLLDGNGNLGLGAATAFGTSAVRVWMLSSGTAPSTSPADAVQLWSADRGGTAGKASLHLRSEDGTSHVLGDRVGLGTLTPTSFLEVAGSLALPINGTAKTTTYTATISDSTIQCDATSGAFTVNLPTASGIPGRLYTIKKIDSSANAITVDGNGSETIDGATTKSLAAQWDWITVQSDGTNWKTLASSAAGGGTVTGSGTATYLAVWSGASALTGYSTLLFSSNTLAINRAADSNASLSLDSNSSGKAYAARITNSLTGGSSWGIAAADDSYSVGGSKLIFNPNIADSGNTTFRLYTNGTVGLGSGTYNLPTSLTNGLVWKSGVAPSGNYPTDGLILWVADRGATAGKAGLHVRSEDGSSHVFSDKVGLLTTSPAASAAVEISSTTGGLLLPRLTTTERDAISSPAAGLLIYNTTTGKLNVRGASAWEAVTSA